MCSQEGPGPSAYIRNVRAPMPLDEKLRLLSKNTWVKISRMQACCGHPGEPGC